MGKETEIELKFSDESNNSAIGEPNDFSSIENSEDHIKSVLDERDYIPPIKDAGERAATASGDDLSLIADNPDEPQAPVRPDVKDPQTANLTDEPESEIPFSNADEQGETGLSAGNSETDLPGESLKANEDSALKNQAAGGKDAAAAAAGPDTDEPDGDPSENSTETLPSGASAGLAGESKLETAPDHTDSGDGNDFAGLDDGEVEIGMKTTPTESLPKPEAAQTQTTGDSPVMAGVTLEVSAAAKSAVANKAEKTAAHQRSPASDSQNRQHQWSLVNKLSSIVVVLLISAGTVLYMNPSLIGLSRTPQPVIPASNEMPPVVEPVQQPLPVSSAPSKREQCQARLDEAVQLRQQLLEKKSEIFQLDHYYRDGNTEMGEEILQEIDRSGITTFQAAMENNRIELTLRTIQRRQAYIEELKKPAHWLNSGIEELYYLIRRAELDLQLTDVAGGIDLNRHLRHISAAIQKYRPGPDKLAIDPLKTELEPLEKIWKQVGQSKTMPARRTANPQDELIINQICNGNYERMAELTHISPSAATCLARMKGSDLFLNGVTSLSVDAAKRLFQWQGNWICLNGLKNLSEAAAQNLFRWGGNWISLNSLTAFPPELAQHLLKWEGQQLELMGLGYSGTKAEQKMLKYLALWETTGGKLFVPGNIRQELKRLM